ncbi:MAG: hypothetical protein CML60_11115 [Rhodobacteraceae bacterium]|nr:hypothetical protein [Paracoccaceae bacterium]
MEIKMYVFSNVTNSTDIKKIFGAIHFKDTQGQPPLRTEIADLEDKICKTDASTWDSLSV